uniref:Uncharacterized protein n=1 Tax=Vespula pensylvanica TaxID=30213 RepID=A0A834PB05_VESPE|nr:hypothetical protein H0235_002991 [Vespula pensylvanica]
MGFRNPATSKANVPAGMPLTRTSTVFHAALVPLIDFCTWLARLKFCSASVPASHGHYVNEVGCFRRKFVEDFYIIMFCKPSVGRIKTASNSGVFLRKSENVLGLGTL